MLRSYNKVSCNAILYLLKQFINLAELEVKNNIQQRKISKVIKKCSE